jgi:hypothetical protein
MAKSIARRALNNISSRKFRKAAFHLESLEPRNLLASATPDTYTIDEDAVLTTGLLTAVPLRAPGWDINDELLISVNQYPTDGGGRVWNAVDYDVTTSVIGANPSAWDRNLRGAFQSGTVNAFNGQTPTTVNVPSATETTFLARKSFTLTAAQAAATSGTITYTCDSGCVFYINGVEAGFSPNMDPALPDPGPRPLTPNSFADDAGDEDLPNATVTVSFGGAGQPALIAGNNVFAVETHNDSTTSSDIGFDASLQITGGPQSVAANDSTVGAATYTVTTQPTNGTVTMQADGNFTYTPNANFFGSDSFIYNVTDSGAPSSAMVTITINSVNDPPTTQPDFYTAIDGATISVTTPTAVPFVPFRASGWAVNDELLIADNMYPTDAGARVWNARDYDVATSVIGANPSAWDTNLTAPFDDGGITAFNGMNPTAIDAPSATETTVLGRFNFTLTASQAAATSGVLAFTCDSGCVIYINGVEAGSSANMEPADVARPLTPNSFAATGGDEDLPHEMVTVNFGGAGQPALFVGTNVLAIEAHNDSLTSSDIGFDVSLEAGPTAGVLNNDSDAEGSPLTAVLGDTSNLTGQGTLTFNADGTFTFVPSNPNIVGAFTFTYTATDGTTPSAPTTVTLTYNASNAAPVAVDDAYFVSEGQTLNVSATAGIVTPMVPLTSTGWDVNDELLIADNQYPTDAGGRNWAAVNYDVNTSTIGGNPAAWETNQTAPFDCTTGGTPDIQMNCTGAVGAFTGAKTNVHVPPATETTFLARKTFTLDAAQVAASPLGRITYTCDSGCIMYVNGVRAGSSPNMANITNPTPNSFAADDGDEALPHATITFPFGGVGNPVLNVGTNVIAIEVHNNSTASSDIGFDLSLEGVSLAGVLANDTDAEGSPLTAEVVDAANVGGNLTLNPNGTFTYTPNAGVAGTRTFTYRASDGTRFSTPATVTFSISPSDSGPYTAVADSYTTDEDVNLVIAGDSVVGAPGTSLIDNDTHPGDESDPVTITILTQATNGVVTLNGNTGGFTYNPDEEFSGSDSFVYQVDDGFGSITSATVNITVNNVDDVPLGAADTFDVPGTLTIPATTTYLLRRSNWEFLDTVNNGLQDMTPSTPEPYPTDLGGNQWFEEDFDTSTGGGDGAWEFGPGVFGSPRYGVNPGATTLLDGIDGAFNGADNSVTTYLFRTTFNVANGASVSALGMNIFADDGVVVYINGTEVLRQNMPAAPAVIATDTFASGASADEFSYVRHNNVNVAGLLHNGTNTVAVELHQQSVDSSDVAFDMAITNAGPISVLSNDSDRENDPLTATILATDTQPTKGTATMQPDGRFTYTANAGATGADTFQYRVNGATQSAAVTVTVNITSTTPCTVGDADLNNDLVVNKADLAILSRNYGSNAPAADQGDVNCDGRIGLRDLVLLRNQIVTPSPSAPDALVAAVNATAVDRVLTGLDRAINAVEDRAPRAAARLAQIRDRISDAADDAGQSGSEVRDAARRVIRATRGRIAAHARAIGDLFDRTA